MAKTREARESLLKQAKYSKYNSYFGKMSNEKDTVGRKGNLWGRSGGHPVDVEAENSDGKTISTDMLYAKKNNLKIIRITQEAGGSMDV